jgi:signal transduction histidine kinase
VSDGEYGHTVEVSRDDEMGHLTSAFNDMSRRLESMRLLEQQLRLRDRLSALGEMALGIAHEVRNPLGIIKTSAELLRRKADLPAEHDKLLVNVIDEVDRIDASITEFMAFANPTQGELRSIDLAGVIERACTFCQPQFAANGVEFALHNHEPRVRVLGDERLIHEAVLNLVLNALEAMPHGGRLEVRVRAGARSVTVDVSDTGPGVPDELRERIFNPFFTTKPSGTGLGLPKVHAVMERHNGSIQCLAMRDSGTTFRLLFPVDPAEVPHA